MTRYLLPIVFVIALFVVFVIGLERDPSKLPSTFIGKPAPQFDLPELQDPAESVSNASFAGQTVLVNFWATWCAGCRQEHGFLMRLAESGAIPIYGINWRDDRRAAIDWLERLRDPYVMSGYDGENRVGIDWGVYAAPETFLVGGDGTVLHKHLGPLDERIWQRDFVPHLETATPESPSGGQP